MLCNCYSAVPIRGRKVQPSGRALKLAKRSHIPAADLCGLALHAELGEPKPVMK